MGVLKEDDKGTLHSVRELNDLFRTEGQGNGTILITPGLQGLGDQFVHRVFKAVREFSEFSNENDPWGEHDFGAIDIDGHKVFWKIDYYNPSLTAGSEIPADDEITHRVLTILLASEY